MGTCLLTRIIGAENAEAGFIFKVENVTGDQRPNYCLQCAKCTSACPVAKLQPEYRPHQIVNTARLGLAKELFSSSNLVWSCALCFKCKEICPQDVAPSDLMLALRNVSVERGISTPLKFHEVMLKSFLRNGRYQPIQMIRGSDGKYFDRTRLALPPLTVPQDLKKFASLVEKILKGTNR